MTISFRNRRKRPWDAGACDHKIYFLFDAKTGFIKIGCSRVPEYRQRVLANELQRPLYLIYARRVPRDAFRVETRLHQRFAPERKFGEWFAVAPERAKAALGTILRQAGFA
jgi:hypothetical protein